MKFPSWMCLDFKRKKSLHESHPVVIYFARFGSPLTPGDSDEQFYHFKSTHPWRINAILKGGCAGQSR